MQHTATELKQMQMLPLDQKIQLTKERIEAWYEAWWRYEIENLDTGKIRYVTWDNRDYSSEPPIKDNEWIKSAKKGAVYVSFSGGKDSTVLKHIVDSMYDDVPSVFVNTGLEYPEIQKFAKAQKNVTVLHPDMRFDEVIKKFGYPVISKEISQVIYEAKKNAETGKYDYRIARINGELKDKDGNPSMFNCSKYKFLMDAPFDISHMCCHQMKKKPTKQYEHTFGRVPMTGMMASESKVRLQAWMRTGCNAFDKQRPQSQPMAFWTEQDVLHYIRKYNVPYCSVYGDIVSYDPNGVDEQLSLNGDYDYLKTTGCERTGCIFCMFGCHLEKEPNRFQRLKETHPRQYEYCIGGGEMVDGKWQPNKDGLGLGFVLDYIGVKY